MVGLEVFLQFLSLFSCVVQNVLDACVSTLIWWSVGYGFAFGENGTAPNPFIGGTVRCTTSVLLLSDPMQSR